MRAADCRTATGSDPVMSDSNDMGHWRDASSTALSAGTP